MGTALSWARITTIFAEGKSMRPTRPCSPYIALALLALCFIFLPFHATATERPQQNPLETVKTAITTISASEAEAIHKQGAVLFLDVREPNEFSRGHIPGAVNLPMGQVKNKIAQTASDKDAPILVYCRSGRRSALVAADLMTQGYTHPINLGGGLNAWSKAGYTVE